MTLKRIRDFVLISLIPLTFGLVTPWNNLDGNNPVKFLVVVILGAVAFSLSLPQIIGALKFRAPDPLQVVNVVFLIWTIASLTFNRYSIDERLFGIYGRSLGAITFISLFMLLASASMFNWQTLKLFNCALVISLFLVGGYFAVQLGGLDPVTWEDPYAGVPSSTLGNPNFVSSSLAILSVPLLMLVFYPSSRGLLLKFGPIALLGVISFLIWETRSIQGLIILLILFAGLLLIRINDFYSYRLGRLIQIFTIFVVVASPIITLLVALGLSAQPGGATMIARSEYWRSALNLILDKPLFGTGFDSFGDWYFLYRDQLAIDRSSNLFTDSTHNLLLELGVFGGLPLLTAYVVLQALALRSAMRILTSLENLQAKAIVVTWIGFHLQSAISPSSLPLLMLGTVLTGLVYGTGQAPPRDASDKGGKNLSKSNNYPLGIVGRFATSTLALMIVGAAAYPSVAPIVKDARFRDAIEQGDGRKMIEVSRDWPFNYNLSRQAAITLKSNGYNDLAIDMVRDLIDTNPNNIQGWRMLFEYSTLSSDRLRALSRMKELDPLNPELARLTP